jgi:polyferredoxin
VLHDRNPQYVVNSNGSIRNAYTVRILNKASVTRNFELVVDGLPEETKLEVAGEPVTGENKATVMVDGDQTREVRALVVTPPGEKLKPSTDVVFRIRDLAGGNAAVHRDFFKAP